MSRYTERLWRELVRQHGADLAGISRPTRRDRVARPRLLAGTSVGLAGVGTAVALALGAAGSAPAFAVTENHDGTVSVEIRQFTAMKGVNAKLAKLGFRARFVQVPAGCTPPPPPYAAAFRLARSAAALAAVTAKPGFVHAQFDPRRIPVGKTLVVGAWREGGVINVRSATVAAGAAPACLLGEPWASIHGVTAVPGYGAGVQCLRSDHGRPAIAGFGMNASPPSPAAIRRSRVTACPSAVRDAMLAATTRVARDKAGGR
jgi:hypothetical protein